MKEEHVARHRHADLRELSSGIYFGPRGDRQVEGPQESCEREVFDTELYSEHEIERMARDGFRLADARRKKVTLIAKSNVMASGLFWREVVEEIAQEFPDVALDYMHVDAASMELILNPRQFDVIITSNIFGDILSDEAAGAAALAGHGPVRLAEREGLRPLRADPRLARRTSPARARRTRSRPSSAPR